MKKMIFKRLAAFVTAMGMAAGGLTVLPEGCLPEFGILASAEETEVAIDATNFPDETFRNYVLTNFDTDGSNTLSVEECEKATEISMVGTSKNPLAVKSLKGVEFLSGLQHLGCSYSLLESLDVSRNTNLISLSCSEGKLTSLDVSGLENLTYVFCGYNQLTSLDASGCTNLADLSCGDNQLTSLNIGSCTNLVDLSFGNNQLTSVDLSSCTNLEDIYCKDNQLTSLDVSGNTKLDSLSCQDNQITSIDVSNNSYLTELICYNNQLTSLDVSNNPDLNKLWCQDNQITSLDVSGSTKLIELICYNNQITSLDVSDKTNLTKLHCSKNQLTSLDLSHNVNLSELQCGNNKLTSLDVSKNTNLTFLHCSYNQITSLDVSDKTNLTKLYCNNNQLTSLDLSNDTNLNTLWCNNNQLTSLDLSTNPSLSRDTNGVKLADNEYLVTAENGVYDLSKLNGFNPAKASDWQGAAYNSADNTITVPFSGKVTYVYDCGSGFSTTFTLKVTVTETPAIPDTPTEGEVKPRTEASGTTAQEMLPSIATTVETLKGAVLDEDDKALVAAGVSIDVKLKSADIAAEIISEADKIAIESALDSSKDEKIGVYIDLSLFKEYSNGKEAIQVTQTKTPIAITVNIPASIYASDRTYSIIRVHDGIAENLGGMYDKASRKLTFYTDKFSTYAIAYKDTTDEEETVPDHTHSYGTEWKSDNTSHWHECSCGEKADIAGHVSDGGKVTVPPTATTAGVRTYSCSVCGYVMRTETIPATGNSGGSGDSGGSSGNGGNGGNGGYPTYPSTTTDTTTSTTTTTSSETDKLTVKATTNGDKVTLKWNEIKGAKSYTVYQYKDGKYVKIKDTTKTTVAFKSMKNGKTYKFLVKYTQNDKLCSTSKSGKVSVTAYYKPIAKATATENSVRLKWEAVPEAEKYAVYKYVNGKAVKLAETEKTAVRIKELKPDTEYEYIVRAYVDGEWTTMKKSDIVTVSTK